MTVSTAAIGTAVLAALDGLDLRIDALIDQRRAPDRRRGMVHGAGHLDRQGRWVPPRRGL